MNINLFKDKSKISSMALVFANFIFAAVAIFQKWGYYYVLLAFWFEVLIIGFYNLARVTVACLFGNPIGKAEKWVAISFPMRFFILIVTSGFFIVKFGGFAIGLGILILVLPAGLANSENTDGLIAMTDALDNVGSAILIAIAVFFISHGISFIFNYLKNQEYKNDNILKLLFFPYARMFLILIIFILGIFASAIMPALNRMTTFAVVVILLKLFIDLLSHNWEHKQINLVKTI